MDRKVIINIIGKQVINGEEKSTEFVTVGRYYEQNGIKGVQYDESMLMGTEGSVTTIEVNGDTVSLMRSGNATSHMVIKKGEKCLNHYRTPLGNIEMGILPLNVKYDMKEDSGTVDLTYQLDFEGEFASMNRLQVSYNAAKNNYEQ